MLGRKRDKRNNYKQAFSNILQIIQHELQPIYSQQAKPALPTEFLFNYVTRKLPRENNANVFCIFEKQKWVGEYIANTWSMKLSYLINHYRWIFWIIFSIKNLHGNTLVQCYNLKYSTSADEVVCCDASKAWLIQPTWLSVNKKEEKVTVLPQ